MNTAKYNPNQERKAHTQEKLNAVEHRRHGHKRLTLTTSRSTEPTATKNCKYCGNPSPIIQQDARFICRKCVVIFS